MTISLCLQRIVFVCLLLGALFFAASPCEAQTKRAVLIGIDCYNPNAPECGSLESAPKTQSYPRAASTGNWLVWKYANLRGAVADVDLMDGILKTFGFDTVTLKNGQATADAILSTLRKNLVDDTKAGDVRVVYYSGHGNYVRNTASKEADSFDQTIVPADHFRGVADVRDKEISRILFAAGSKGVKVVFIADSCHSGSLTRGALSGRRLKTAESGRADGADSPAVKDAADIDKKTGKPIDPATVGVISFSAAQRSEPAEEADLSADSSNDNSFGLAHGAFTWALKRSLDSGANQDIDTLNRRVIALLRADNATQVPVAEGKELNHTSIFGGPADGSGTQTAIVEAVDGNKVRLRGGKAVGIYQGTELKRLTKGEPKLEIKVTAEEGMSLSDAVVTEHGPGAVQIKPGEVFEVDKWVIPVEAMLKVYVPPTAPEETVYQAAAEIGKLKADSSIQWLEDPTMARPTYVMRWDGKTWLLEAQPIVTVVSKKNGYVQTSVPAPPVDLGLAPKAEDVRKHLPEAAQFFFWVPPTPRLAERLTGTTSRGLGGNIDVLRSAAGSQYSLFGHTVDGNVEYAWVEPGATEDSAKSAKELPLPLRSDWILAQGTPESVDRAASQIVDKAQRIGRLRAWLVLPDLGGSSQKSFPYHLVFREVGTNNYVNDGELRDGSKYKMYLKADPKNPTGIVALRWIYIFAIDHFGKGTLLFPVLGRGNEGNQFPPKAPEASEASAAKPLVAVNGDGDEEDFSVGPPFGTDTYLMLTTEEPIDNPEIFEFDGARSKGSTRGIHSENPLTALLSGVGNTTRAALRPVPTSWSVERLTFRSVPVQ